MRVSHRVAPEPPLAPIPRRVLARGVDLLLEFGPAILAAVLIPSSVVGFAAFMLLLIAGAAQDILGTARWGKSIGKALLRIRVVDEHSQQPPDLWHAFLRWWLPTLLPPLLVWATWDERRQGIHDKAASTLVVRSS